VSAWQAVQSLIELLGAIPPGVVPASHVSARRPAAPADLSAVVVSAAEVTELPAGVGGTVATRRLSATAWSSVTATRSEGQLAIELWAADAAGMTALANAAFAALRPSASKLAEAGFLRLAVRSAGPIDEALLGVGGSDTALRLPIGCSFAYEAATPEETGPGGLIKTIHVDVRDDFHEVMELP
jgi:hypothetical protein